MLLGGSAVLLTTIAAGLSAQLWVRRQAGAEGSATAAAAALSAASVVNSELQKFGLLPIALVEYPGVQSVLRDPTTAGSVNSQLKQLADATNAAAIYVVRADGLTVAASNWDLPSSFVGQNYRFREYFRQAMQSGAGEFFALGKVSHRSGMFLARRVEQGGRILGVVVVKVEFYALEKLWASQHATTMVADPSGVILISSRPDWRFKTLRPLSAIDRQRIEEAVQFPGAELLPLPLKHLSPHVVSLASQKRLRASFAEAIVKLPRGWTLHRWEPLGPLLATAWTRAIAVMLLAAVCLIVLVAMIVVARERRRLRLSAQAKLERQVAERTSALTAANAQLRLTSEEREVLASRFRRSREELAQANRLGLVGQITAGVVHEVNQPVAAIRTFADNALVLLNRGDCATTASNLRNILELADRIGKITKEMRSFTRRRTPELRVVPLVDAIEGTLLLIGDAVRLANIEFRYDHATVGSLAVRGDHVRLEQVLINLVQNSIDALGGVHGWIELSVARKGARVEISVSDSGPGVCPKLAETLFIPFVTGKSNGLGLGLGIARDIARSLNGELVYIAGPTNFRFVLDLPLAC